MTFTEAIRVCLIQKYARFSGRAARSEFWWFMLLNVLVFLALFLAIEILFALGLTQSGGRLGALMMMIPFGIGALYMLAMLLPGLSVMVRRLHDTGYPNWWYLLLSVSSVIPYVENITIIGFIIFFAMPGTPGPNRFGPDPLRPDMSAEIFS